MLTVQEIEAVRRSEQISLEEVLSGGFGLETMEDYFRRELKENLLEQGWELPDELKDPDDDTAAIPDYLKVRPDPDRRNRFTTGYDGKQEEDIPHYGSLMYWQWLAVKNGRINYLRAYARSGEEIRISGRLFGKLVTQVRDHLMSKISNPISHKGYRYFKIDVEHLDIEEMEDLSFVTCYLF